jgi:NAD(P)-dependent dehydrogenase (short-subunit alcohol dehydrogenase family)
MYYERGYSIVGTFRIEQGLAGLPKADNIIPLYCDLSDPAGPAVVAKELRSSDRKWDLFISAVGQLSPVDKFFEADIDTWCDSTVLNSLAQLRLLHSIYPYRRQGVPTRVVFLVGGGVNGPFTNYSAYCLGKIALIKMCELLDDEYPDVHAIAIGTGWVNTKIHKETLEAGARAGENLRRTYEFLNSGTAGTSVQDIFDCINWCFDEGRDATGGRNFSVVHDSWREGGSSLLAALREDPNKFKLRRDGN